MVALVALMVVVAQAQAQQQNLRPIVGILTQPIDSSFDPSLGTQYMPASYVKFVESAGAQVVPVFYNSTTEELQEVFNSINGILFPGGSSDLDYTPLYYAGKFFLDASVNAWNTNKDYFPVFGHCQGFELISYVMSQNITVLTGVNAENYSIPLNFTTNLPTSRWLGQAPSNIVEILATQPVTLNNHVWALSPESYQNNEYLSKLFRVISTNLDRNGREFISTFEAFDYPIYGIQWHAEKPLFEWNLSENINHSPDAIEAMQYFSNFIGSEARKSMHTYSSYATEVSSLIYNWSPTYTALMGSDFEQCYFW